MSVFKKNNKSNLSRHMFLDGGVDIQRFDLIKYRQFDKLTDKQLGFFWRPEEVDVYRDGKDFRDLTPNEQHIFTSNLKRQILLDSVQGRAPVEAFGALASLPELENWLITWTFNETVHSLSLIHI
jgi:ribonucleoside-diphosphate reductase beta chain